MKRINILFVVALAVIVLMLGPLSAMASPITTLNNISKTFGTPNCISGTCGNHAFGSSSTVANKIAWNVGDPAVSNQQLFTIAWSGATGSGYELDSTVQVVFHFVNPADTIIINGTVDEKNPSGLASETLAFTFDGPVTAKIGGEYITVSLKNVTLTPSTDIGTPFIGSISVPEPSLAMLLPLGLVFVGGIRKRFLA